MTYCALQDLLDRGWQDELIQLTDRVNTPATTINETTVAAHIADAVSVVDGYLAKRYTLPLTDVPAALKKTTADLARFFLNGDAAEKDSPVERAYQAAIKWLRDVSSGLIIIENAGLVPIAAGGGQVQTSAPDRVFSRNSMRDF